MQQMPESLTSQKETMLFFHWWAISHRFFLFWGANSHCKAKPMRIGSVGLRVRVERQAVEDWDRWRKAVAALDAAAKCVKRVG